MDFELSNKPTPHKDDDVLLCQMDGHPLFPPFVCIYKSEDGFILSAGGFIMLRDEFERISESVNQFYKLHSDEEITQYNDEIRQDKEEERRAAKITPAPPMRTTRPGFIYVVACDGLHKIGKSKQVSKRIEKFETIYPHDLEVVLVTKVNDMQGVEDYLHSRYNDQRVKGEWFKLTPHDVDQIKLQYQHVEDWRNW